MAALAQRHSVLGRIGRFGAQLPRHSMVSCRGTQRPMKIIRFGTEMFWRLAAPALGHVALDQFITMALQPSVLSCSDDQATSAQDAQPAQRVCRYNLPAPRSALAPLFQCSAAPALGCSGAAISALGRSGSRPFECSASPALSFPGTRPLSLARSATPALGHSGVRTLRCSVAPVLGHSGAPPFPRCGPLRSAVQV